MIELAGLKPDVDIKIEFTGVRPGEKLYEELTSMLDDTVPTDHEQVRVFVGNQRLQFDIDDWLRSLKEICTDRDTAQLVSALREMVIDYSPSPYLMEQIAEGQRSAECEDRILPA
jgi:FlaA1/EpsC-like NDP-sugar epimerase